MIWSPHMVLTFRTPLVLPCSPPIPDDRSAQVRYAGPIRVGFDRFHRVESNPTVVLNRKKAESARQFAPCRASAALGYKHSHEGVETSRHHSAAGVRATEWYKPDRMRTITNAYRHLPGRGFPISPVLTRL